MLKRFYDLEKLVQKNKVLVIYGPRRAGKTTLLRNFLNQSQLKYKLDSGDNLTTQNILKSQEFSQVLKYATGYELIAIDEAQQIPNIGMGLKIIVDQVEDIMIIATGSSSFELSQQIGEPLTGRKKTIILYPLSQKELAFEKNRFDLESNLPDYLIFGSYPEVITAENNQEKQEILTEITDSYLIKDILALEKVKSPQLLINLLRLLAFQLGQQVSLNELANKLKINLRTVERYLDLLEKGFVIKRLGAFQRNLRREIAGKSKYYFYDNGIRNALIGQFNPLEQRNDIGTLFENFIFMERIKKCAYDRIFHNFYYWRTYDGKEIDLVEEGDGQLRGFEFKWSQKKKVQPPKDWLENYQEAGYKVINRDNYLDFIL